ncbi:MAG: RNA polymerase sigma factor [Byssovorax sp.]
MKNISSTAHDGGEREHTVHEPIAATAHEEAAGVEAVFPLVYRMMHALAGPSRDLDDLVQTANEQVLRALPSFEGRARFSTWVYRICYLTMLKESRWHRRWLRRFTLTADGELPEQIEIESSAEALLRRERERRLRAAIDRLSPKRRAALVMRELQGMEIDEIAAIVGVNALTVRSRVRDARKELAALLAADPYFGDEACGTPEGDGS